MPPMHNLLLVSDVHLCRLRPRMIVGRQRELVGLLDPFDRGELRITLGTRWISGFCPLIPEVAYHVDHTRSTLYYIPVMIRHFGLRAFSLYFRYVAFALGSLRHAGGRNAIAGPRHAERRRALAAASGLPEEKLVALERVAVKPRLASVSAS